MQLLVKNGIYFCVTIYINDIPSLSHIWAQNLLKLVKCSTLQKHLLTKIIILPLSAEVMSLVLMVVLFCLWLITFC
jgi:hypothetical protein